MLKILVGGKCEGVQQLEEREICLETRVDNITTEANVTTKFHNLYFIFNFHSVFVSRLAARLNKKVLKQRDTKQTANTSVKRTEIPTDLLSSSVIHPTVHQSSVLLLNMFQKGRSTHKRR